MARTHTQLSREERWRLARLQAEGRSARQIAATLDRAPSTITRELKRNARADGGYDPDYAQQQTRARRFRGLRLERDAELREQVLNMLAAGLSPPAGRRAAQARSRAARDLA